MTVVHVSGCVQPFLLLNEHTSVCGLVFLIDCCFSVDVEIIGIKIK